MKSGKKVGVMISLILLVSIFSVVGVFAAIETDDLCYKGDSTDWNCGPNPDQAYSSATGLVTYENYGSQLEITVTLSGLKADTVYQLAIQGRDGGDGNTEIGENCDNPNDNAEGYECMWECGEKYDEGFWNFDMTATTDSNGDYTNTYYLDLDEGHYGEHWDETNGDPGLQKCWDPGCDTRTMWGAGFIVKEITNGDSCTWDDYVPVLMETNGLDWEIGEDDDSPDVEVINPPDMPFTWLKGDILIQGTVTETWPGSGIDIVETQIGDQFGTWYTPFIEMSYEGPYYEYLWDSNDAEDACSEANVKIRALDNAGNEGTDTNKFGIDNEPPVTEKEVGEPNVDDYYVKTTTPITLTATDCGSGVDYIHYEVWWDSDDNGVVDTNLVDEDVDDDEVTFYFDRESLHEIRWYAVDNLENIEEEHTQEHAVDETAPEIEKVVGDPKIPCEQGEDCDYYITQQTPITLTCIDPNPHPVNQVILYWRDYLEGQTAPDFTPEFNGIANIQKTEDSRHILEWYCVDALGNSAGSKSEPYQEIDIVESMPPVIEKQIIGPWYGDCPPTPGTDDRCYIDGVTQISVHVYDSEPHPVNDVVCEWDYTVDGGDKIIGGQGLGTDFIVIFPEESIF